MIKMRLWCKRLVVNVLVWYLWVLNHNVYANQWIVITQINDRYNYKTIGLCSMYKNRPAKIYTNQYNTINQSTNQYIPNGMTTIMYHDDCYQIKHFSICQKYWRDKYNNSPWRFGYHSGIYFKFHILHMTVEALRTQKATFGLLY